MYLEWFINIIYNSRLAVFLRLALIPSSNYVFSYPPPFLFLFYQRSEGPTTRLQTLQDWHMEIIWCIHYLVDQDEPILETPWSWNIQFFWRDSNIYLYGKINQHGTHLLANHKTWTPDPRLSSLASGFPAEVGFCSASNPVATAELPAPASRISALGEAS
jgi:hypothetical protein